MFQTYFSYVHHYSGPGNKSITAKQKSGHLCHLPLTPTPGILEQPGHGSFPAPQQSELTQTFGVFRCLILSFTSANKATYQVVQLLLR